MRWNREDNPRVKASFDIDRKIHLVDSFGGTWCEDKDVELDGGTSLPDPSDSDLCVACKASAVEEGFLVE